MTNGRNSVESVVKFVIRNTSTASSQNITLSSHHSHHQKPIHIMLPTNNSLHHFTYLTTLHPSIILLKHYMSKTQLTNIISLFSPLSHIAYAHRTPVGISLSGHESAPGSPPISLSLLSSPSHSLHPPPLSLSLSFYLTLLSTLLPPTVHSLVPLLRLSISCAACSS